jgi:adenylosuccinate lyase
MSADLDANQEVLAEAIQTVMRRFGQGDAYEQLKELTRGEKITADTLRTFVEGLDLPGDIRQRLLTLEPATYTGIAATLAKKLTDSE